MAVDAPTTDRQLMRPRGTAAWFVKVTGAAALSVLSVAAGTTTAHADNRRLNESVVANVYTIQRQAGCATDLEVNPQLRLAAQWHTDDLLNNRALKADVGSDGSSPQDRAAAAGYRGMVAQTVAINPAMAISSLDLIRMWYLNPASLAVMRDCSHSQIGVWSANSIDRTVVVAVYGKLT